MKMNEEDVKKVLALFDDEDIPYINFDYLIQNNIIEFDNVQNKKSPIKVRKLGGRNDRTTK